MEVAKSPFPNIHTLTHVNVWAGTHCGPIPVTAKRQPASSGPPSTLCLSLPLSKALGCMQMFSGFAKEVKFLESFCSNKPFPSFA